MSQNRQTTNSVAPQSTNEIQADGRVSIATWAIGSAAFIVALTAGALLLGEKKSDVKTAEPETQSGTSTDPSEKKDALAELTPANPLNITSSFLDAQERGRLWAPSAMLCGIELVVADGKPMGPLVFEYGQAAGGVVPGAPMSTKRQLISYEGAKVGTKSIDSSNMRTGLPEPNCPLDVAFRKLEQSGSNTSGRVGVLYAHSAKHGRPVWLMTNEQGEATSIDAESCALLRR